MLGREPHEQQRNGVIIRGWRVLISHLGWGGIGNRWPAFFCFLLGILCIFCIWVGLATISKTRGWGYPYPTEAFRALVQDYEILWECTKTTMSLSLIGTVASVVFGIPMTILLYLLPTLGRCFQPILTATQNVPSPLWALLLVLPLGMNVGTGLFIVFLSTFFPIFVSMSNGMQQVDPGLQTYLKIAGASRWQHLIHLALPSSIGPCFSGLRLAFTYSIWAGIWAEGIGIGENRRGIGWVVRESSRVNFRMDRLFAATFLLVISGLIFVAVLYVVFYFVFRRSRKWGGL